MKKSLLFAAAATIALSASAEGRQKAVNSGQSLNLKPVTEQNLLPFSSISVKAVDFATVEDLAGTYTWSYFGLLNNDSGSRTATASIKVVDAATGEIEILGIAPTSQFSVGVKGTVDLAAGTVTVANEQLLGPDSYGDTNYFYLKDLDMSTGEVADGPSSVKEAVATISGNVITFPQNLVFAIGDPNDEELGWWKLTALNSLEPYVEPSGELDLTEWEDFTTATMIDGWIVPLLLEDEWETTADYPIDGIKVMRNIEDPNLLALIDPYVTLISSATSGAIVLDIKDPEFVGVLPGVYCGVDNGTNKICCINNEGFYMAKGLSKETIMDAKEELGVNEWSTYKEEDGKTIITIGDCRFNYLSALDKCYSWNGMADIMVATITLDAVVGVEAILDNEVEAPAEYFNLQGIRVAEPANGLYIVRQGSKVSKVVK